MIFYAKKLINILYGMKDGIWVMCCFFAEGRQERGLARPGGVRSRMLRIPKHSAGTLWLWTVASPSSLPLEAKGAAWLRPWVVLQKAKGF